MGNRPNQAKENMDTLSETMNRLIDDGYSEEFCMSDLGFTTKSGDEVFKPDDLVIIKIYRFEGESDPADMSVLYKMESNTGLKGYFLHAFGTYGLFDEVEMSEFLKKIKREEEDIRD